MFSFHGWEVIQEFLEAVTAFKVFEQELDRDPRSFKDGISSEYLRINCDWNFGHVVFDVGNSVS